MKRPALVVGQKLLLYWIASTGWMDHPRAHEEPSRLQRAPCLLNELSASRKGS